jgi:hypothetical protein
MKKYFLFMMLIAMHMLSACASQSKVKAASECASQGIGPCVTGRLAGQNVSRQIPFSPYTGDPVLTTEEFVKVKAIGKFNGFNTATTTMTGPVGSGDFWQGYGAATTFNIPASTTLLPEESTLFYVSSGPQSLTLKFTDATRFMPTGAALTQTLVMPPNSVYAFKWASGPKVWYSWNITGLTPGTPAVITSDYQPTTINNGDHFIEFPSANVKFTMPKISTAIANGTRDGSIFYIQGYRYGTVATMVYPDTCYMPNSVCPTSIRAGDLWAFQLNGNVWRAIKLPRQTLSKVDLALNSSTTIAPFGPGSTIFYYNNTATTTTIPANTSLQFVDGESFWLFNRTQTSTSWTVKFTDSIEVATSAGTKTGKTLVLPPGASARVTLYAATGAWQVQVFAPATVTVGN